MTSLVGQTVAHYRILEKLGEGGMGVVYKAEDLKLTRSVALKFLPPGLDAHEPERARFLQEAQAAATLNHPNICTVHDIQEHEGQQFIVMEYVEGKTLREIVPVKKMQDAITYAIQIAEALQEAHGKGIIHRDIKAENIMVNTKNQVKVMDFGLAKLKGSLKLTKTSSTVGTLAYMAPEQIQGEAVDARSDIFSFGVVVYEMLAGRLPFQGEHDAAIMYSILNEEPVSLQTHIQDVPLELLHTVNRALEKNPEERYQSVHEMLIDLRRLKKETSRVLRPSAEIVGREARTPTGTGGLRGFSRTARWIIAGVALIVAGITGWLIFRPGEGGIGNEKSVAVMYFENRSEEKDLDKVLVDMLITNLGRNKDITVVSGQRLFDILKSIGKEDAVAIGKSTATEVAKRAGVKTMLLGSIWSVGGKLNVTGQLLDVATGAVINSDRVEASRAEEVFAIADRLTEKVNEWLKGSPTEALRIADATTGSYDAYRYYEQGMRHLYRFEYPQATRCFEEAVNQDSTFAMGLFRLSMTGGSGQLLSSRPGSNLALARESASRAVLYARNVAEKDRRKIDAWSASLRRDYDASYEILKDLSVKFPEDKEAWFFYGMIAYIKGMREEAVRALEKATEVDRAYSDAYNLLGYFACSVGQYEKAIAAIRTYMALIPDALNAYDSGWEIYTEAGNFDEGLKIAEEGFRRIPTWTSSFSRQAQSYLLMGEPEKARERISQIERLDPASLESTELLRSMVYCFEGRMNEAADVLRRTVERTRSRNDQSNELTARFYLARVLLEANRLDEALKALDAVKALSLEVRKDPSNPWPLLCDYYAGISFASRGEYAKAEASALAIRSAAETRVGDLHYLSYWNGLEAEILLRQGDFRQALSALERAVPVMRWQFPRIRMTDARVSTELGDGKRASQLYDSFRNFTEASSAWSGGDFLDFWIEQSKLDYYMGMMHEHFGSKAEAVSSYKKALTNWKKADEDYPPCFDARKRLLELTK